MVPRYGSGGPGKDRHIAVPRSGDIAVVGMSCLFPRAGSVAAYWDNIMGKVDCISHPPEGWDPLANPGRTEALSSPVRMGGFIADLATFDPLQFGIPPAEVAAADPWGLLVLRVAHQALMDAGFDKMSVDRKRVSVIMGQNVTAITRGGVNLLSHSLMIDQFLDLLKGLKPALGDPDYSRIRSGLKRGLPPFDAGALLTSGPNMLSARICNRLDLMGPNFTVDAACASGLIVVQQAALGLVNDLWDLALVGAVQGLSPAFLHLFEQVGALSPSGRISPYGRQADGTVLGEGVGAVVLKRLEDAIAGGDRIYAVVKGSGISSDGKGEALLAPRAEGQELALRRAYESAGIDPASVGLIEGHGTGTPAGDSTELDALHRVFGDSPSPYCALGSVKSMIGHLTAASGMAGLIKASLALYYRTLPPTLLDPDSILDPSASRSPFYVNSEARPWIHGREHPRRAGVNAFGFGGINAHLILEEPAAEASIPQWPAPLSCEVFILEATGPLALAERCDQLADALPGSSVALKDLAYSLFLSLSEKGSRMALVASSKEELISWLRYGSRQLRSGPHEAISHPNIFYSDQALGEDAKIAFLFPGEGSQYENLNRDLCMYFPEARQWFDLIDRNWGNGSAAQIMFPPPGTSSGELSDLDSAVNALWASSQAMLAILIGIGVVPDAMLGHSSGEFTALGAAGAFNVEDSSALGGIIRDLNEKYREALLEGVLPEAALLAVINAPREQIERRIRDSRGLLHLAIDNSPKHVVLAGDELNVEAARLSLGAAGATCQLLAFKRPYHTPLFEAFTQRVRPAIEQAIGEPPGLPVYSCVLASVYPRDLVQVKEIAASQWSKPVRFRETLENMYRAGIRIFVEVGPKNILTACVGDTLGGRPHAAVAMDIPGTPGLRQFSRVAATLAVHGVHLNLETFFQRRGATPIDLGAIPVLRNDAVPGGLLTLNIPTMRLTGDPHDYRQSEPPDGRDGREGIPDTGAGMRESELFKRHLDLMEEFLSVHREALQIFLGIRSGESPDYGFLQEPLNAPDPPAMPSPMAEELQLDAADREWAPSVSDSRDLPTAALTLDAVEQALKTLIGEKTGYPEEMLDRNVNLEADLGIDSIKRMEIFGLLQKRFRLGTQDDLEALMSLKTIQQILEAVRDLIDGLPRESVEVYGSPAQIRPEPQSRPFVREVESLVPGERAVVWCELDVNEDLYLKDHTLVSGTISAVSDLHGLPVMPLVMTLEAMAEVALQIFPEGTVTGIRDIKAHRWIALEAGVLRLRITARTGSGQTCRVTVEYAAAEGGMQLAAEATVMISDGFPDPPQRRVAPLYAQSPSRVSPELLYSAEFLFHGPAFRAVEAVLENAANGSVAAIRSPGAQGLFASTESPPFVFNPIVLDAAIQVMGLWAKENHRLDYLFPIATTEIAFFEGPPSPRSALRCYFEATGFGTFTSGDMQVRDGERLVLEIKGSRHRRLPMPARLATFFSTPKAVLVTDPLEGGNLLAGEKVRAALFGGPSMELETLSRYGGIWLSVLAFNVLGPKERDHWRSMSSYPPKRRKEWLFGRIAAKDALRLLLSEEFGIILCPADIEVLPGGDGAPLVRLPEVIQNCPELAVSISHSNNRAVAIASIADEFVGFGVDLEPAGAIEDEAEKTLFGEDELGAVASMEAGQRKEWLVRTWCAKEAVEKALRLSRSEQAVHLQADGLEAETGAVFISWNGTSCTAQTALMDDFVVATAFLPNQASKAPVAG